jgi:hypothetical protein
MVLNPHRLPISGSADNYPGALAGRGGVSQVSTAHRPGLLLSSGSRTTGGGGIVNNSESIYVPTRDGTAVADVLVIDAGTFEVVDTIEPLAANTLCLDERSLWVTDQVFHVLQRYDLADRGRQQAGTGRSRQVLGPRPSAAFIGAVVT